MNELALFAGAGGGILGGRLLGWRCVCAVECDAYAASVLVARQNDGRLEPFPVWDDVRTFDGRPWRGAVEVVSGGFPCQDISAAGKGVGIDGARSGLWSEMARIVGEVRPRYVWVENSPMLVRRGLSRVLGDLATLGYDARWGVVGAHHTGAPHKRDRIWVLAYSNEIRRGRRAGLQRSGRRGESENHSVVLADAKRPERRPPGVEEGNDQMRNDSVHAGREEMPSGVGASGGMVADAERDGRTHGHQERPRPDSAVPSCDDVPHADLSRPPQSRRPGDAPGEGGSVRPAVVRGHWWSTEPGLGVLADGLANRMDQHGLAPGEQVPRVARGIPNRVGRLRCIGNGQVPAAMMLAWEELTR